ncbi:SIR2 family protein [Vibrio cholerae]|uniref:SIR2 family protein n=1 Tax=Vibrio cholerae TaxID=666 RepID=UPI00115A712C|nr:SIR2 family protein [Vibrio cholerae]EGR1023511.1 SIR2 family protein [Vibrio cholerae]EGR4410734.1 SIR2 family protein [Vibrio cholerae]EKO5177105.1 SIR2 family protein [Vibrio cholerae]MBJ6968280.1 SIR2 family protein [Vibrio cholerae]MDV2344152.1 SIR2 family protein [Vibrio cholerae]
MNSHNVKDALQQLDSFLAASNQSWLFGAGISVDAKIPLMYPLTDRVLALAAESGSDCLKLLLPFIKGELAEDSHIEHYLSHLGDYIALAERKADKQLALGPEQVSLDFMRQAHVEVLKLIADTVRYGYKKGATSEEDEIGNLESPIVDVSTHLDFISALFLSSQGVANRRRAVRLFTTNYDTLLEDALALNCIPYWDGFSGGAVAFKKFKYGDSEPAEGYQAHLVKLHGSIDWYSGPEGKIWRVRDRDLYPQKESRVLIYPQSTKYIATQRDPFAGQFELLRHALTFTKDHVFITCGYSFGDEHINQEIELSFENPDCRSTLVAFVKEPNDLLRRWQSSVWSNRLYVVSESGLYRGNSKLVEPSQGNSLGWWTFQGLIATLKDGAEAQLV